MSRILYSSKRNFGIKDSIDRKIFQSLKKRSAKMSNARGQIMAVFANDYVGNKINIHGFYEKEELDALSSFLDPIGSTLRDGIALDIGANIGNHSIYFSRMFEQVHAFEPNPLTFKLLNFNLSFLRNAQAYQYGLGETRGTFKLFECEGNFGKSSLKSNGESSSVDVKIIPLDQCELSNANIVFIKIDVEGMEESVLKGGLRTITEKMPVIVFEQQLDDFREGESRSVSLLVSLGYSICWFEGRPDSDEKIRKSLYDVKSAVFGSRNKIVTGRSIPAKFHNMLIAIPPQFQNTLGL